MQSFKKPRGMSVADPRTHIPNAVGSIPTPATIAYCLSFSGEGG